METSKNGTDNNKQIFEKNFQKTIDKKQNKDIIKQTEVLTNKYLKEEIKNGR